MLQLIERELVHNRDVMYLVLLVLLCDDVLLLSQGKLVEKGSPRELLSKYDHQTLEEVFLQVSKQGGEE